jgi:hypothetical protein
LEEEVELKLAEAVFEEAEEAALGSISGTGSGCRTHTDLSIVVADADTGTDACEGWFGP